MRAIAKVAFFIILDSLTISSLLYLQSLYYGQLIKLNVVCMNACSYSIMSEDWDEPTSAPVTARFVSVTCIYFDLLTVFNIAEAKLC